jgi:predicted cupin superfamily sugar epimerase
MLTADELIALLDLKPLPLEGGYYRETYRSADVLPAAALPARYGTDKSAGTAIYYLLTSDTFSALHRLPTDEVYHFYLGDPVEMLQLWPDGSGRVVTLGQDVRAGQLLQAVVPRGVWQGSRLRAGGTFALLGTTMAPGFDFADFEAGERRKLVARYPDHAPLIQVLAKEIAGGNLPG